ncbi:MAG: DDE-type integrase/transposase/recombinase [Acidimicrobiia bacterium]
MPADVVTEALRRLEADPHQPLSFLVSVLEAHFRSQGRELKLPRSTLQRRLAATPAYERVQRARGRTRRRVRFVASEPHQRWQTDAKGPFTIALASGERVAVHVLTILDDATRAVLAARVVRSPTTAEAVRVFREAALRWGLCEYLYADRASIFDAHSFRGGLAQLGVHRINSRARNAPARGKIEAYHRTIEASFVKRLAVQVVLDLVHLQQLLEGVLLGYYQRRRHRGLRQSPEQALGGRVSTRTVPPTRLVEAFREQRTLRAHRVTGEVELQQATWLVPSKLRGQRLEFLLDPPAEHPPQVLDPKSGRPLALRPAAVRLEDAEPEPESERWGEGPLQTLYDDWRGQRRPQAQPGFGLPELYALLARAAGRHVPRTDSEAAQVQRVWRAHGPLARSATEAAFHAIGKALGEGRPIKSYLDALVERIGSRP